jgi:hypothetical protein
MSKKSSTSGSTRKLTVGGQNIFWSHWKDAYAWHQQNNSCPVHEKLTEDHIQLNPNSRMRCPRKFAPPPNFGPPGPNFLGNMAPPSEIWPPRKHSLLYRYKLGNREASSKTNILKVFVSIYSWFA